MSSGLMFLFWFALCIFAIPQYRTEIVRYMERNEREELTIGSGDMSWSDYQFISYMIYFPLVVVQLASQLLADKPPTETVGVSVKKENPNPELQASYIRKLFFIWFTPMVWHSYRKPMETENMYDIRPDDTSRAMVPDFDKYWLESVAKGERERQKNKFKNNTKDKDLDSKSTRGSIFIPLFRSFGGPFYFAGVFRLFIELLAFASPPILKLVNAIHHSTTSRLT